MTNYIEYKFKVAEVEPFNEIIIAMISELPFESFVENEEGFDAYMPKTDENIDQVKEVIDSIENMIFLTRVKKLNNKIGMQLGKKISRQF